MKNIHRLIILLVTTSFAFACSSNNENSVFISEQQQSSSFEISSTSGGSTSKPDENNKSKREYTFEDITLENNPAICENHLPIETVIKKATLLNRGVKRHICPNCGGFKDSYYYDLSEYDFLDNTFMYDGKERELLIDGLLPYGVTVKYENNKLTEIGSKTAKALVYDPDGNLIDSKTAVISIVENTGLANIRIITSTGEDPDYKEKEEYTSMTLSVDNCLAKYQMNNISGGLRVRGNSTNQSSVPKRAWRIKFDKKANMLGLNHGAKEKSWVLLADFFDSSMFRNASAFTMGNDLFNYNNNLYCSDRQHVNVYINNEYRGVYLLAEQQQAKTDRIPINEAEENYTGTDIGYLIEIDGLLQQGHNSDGDYTFTTGSSSSGWGWGGQQSGGSNSVNGVNITDKYYAIKTDCYDQSQCDYIKNYVVNVLKIFKQACRGEKLQILDENHQLIDSPYNTMYETLNEVIDIDSFFRMYVLQEFMKNYDVGWGSFYLYVDFSSSSKVKRLTMSAPWDFDLGEGNKTSGNGIKTNDDYLNGKYANSMTEFNPWLYLLSQTDFFSKMFEKYYSMFYDSGIYEGMINYINYETSAFATDFNNTYNKWDLKNATNSGMSTRRGYENHQEAVNYLLNWYKERKTYLDNRYLIK